MSEAQTRVTFRTTRKLVTRLRRAAKRRGFIWANKTNLSGFINEALEAWLVDYEDSPKKKNGKEAP